MEEEKKKAYSEVVEILKLIDNEEKIEKIPFEVIELIKNNSDPIYKPTIDKEKPLEVQGLRDETFSIMAWIANKYWGEDVTIEQGSTEQNLSNNTETYNKKITTENINSHNKTYTDETIDDNNETDKANNLNAEAAIYNDMEPQLYEQCENLDNLPILRAQTKWYIRIKQKVIKILKLLFRGAKNTKEELS